jgi:hypothetical protein
MNTSHIRMIKKLSTSLGYDGSLPQHLRFWRCTLVGKYQNIGSTSSLYLQWQYSTPSSSWMFPHQFSFPTLARTKWPLLGHSPQLPRFLSYPIQSHVTKFSARLNLKGESRFLQKCGTYVINYTGSRLRRPQFSLPYAQHHARIRWNQVTPTHFTFLKIYFSIILSLCLSKSTSLKNGGGGGG